MKFLNSLLFFVFSVSCIYAQDFQDCNSPFTICELATFKISDVQGIGQTQDVKTSLRCTGNQSFKERNSFWIEWKASSSGVITFVIDPNNETDDLDFVLFKKGTACSDLKEIRCMASGQEIGTFKETSNPCKGSTGLNNSSFDDFELSGCKYADDNYLKFLSVEKGEVYSLLINNYGSANGFTISFEGTASLEPTPECKSKKYLSDLAITSIYPNPALDEINVGFDSRIEEKIQVEILDFAGKKYLQQYYDLEHSDRSILLDIKDIPSGSYLIKFTQGENSTVKQFIKA